MIYYKHATARSGDGRNEDILMGGEPPIITFKTKINIII